MWFLSVAYGATIAIVAGLGGPVATVAWVGAVILGLGWTASSLLPCPGRSRQAAP
jgi:hypothetical protein